MKGTKARASPALLGDLISHDRVCGRCNYSLKGLRTGQPCPECGAVIKGSRLGGRKRDGLTDAPLDYLRSLRAGGLMMAGGSMVACVCTFITYGTSNVLAAGLGVMGGVTWWAGVWIITAPERHNAAVRLAAVQGKWLRNITRLSQVTWLVSLMLLLISAVAKLQAVAARAATPGALNSSNPFFTLQSLADDLVRVHWITIPFCLMALVPVAVRVGRLAEWAEDDDQQSRMNLVAWGLAVGGPLAVWGVKLASLLPPPAALLVTVASVFGAIAVLLSWMAFLWGVMSLASMCAWAVANAIETLESDARLAEKLAEHFRQIAPDVEALNRPGKHGKIEHLPNETTVEPSDDGPIPLAEPEGPAKRIKQG